MFTFYVFFRIQALLFDVENGYINRGVTGMKRKTQLLQSLLCAVLFLIISFYLLVELLNQKVSFNSDDNIRNIIMFIMSILFLIFLLLQKKLFMEHELEKTEYREYLVKELDIDNDNKEDCSNNDLKNAQEETDIKRDDKKDIIALMLKNNDEITEYFRISKSHAKSSYWFSIISCAIGLVILSISVYMIFVKENLQVAVISIISGSITEIISATVFWVHNKSALQLNHYYDALHENEKFLSAVNIVDKLSDNRKDEMYIEIIRKQINIDSKQADKDDQTNLDEKKTTHESK